jgi:hypothetical protein
MLHKVIQKGWNTLMAPSAASIIYPLESDRATWPTHESMQEMVEKPDYSQEAFRTNLQEGDLLSILDSWTVTILVQLLQRRFIKKIEPQKFGISWWLQGVVNER